MDQSEEPVQLMPLALEMHGCASQEEMHSNMDATMERGYTSILAIMDRAEGICSIVGSGPSLKDTLGELTGDVFAINQAARYLMENGVIPKWVMLWDAADIVEQFAIPHPDVNFLVASRCHPKVFEKLRDCKVYVWHAGGDHDINDYLSNRKIMEPMINGGSAGVTRAIFVANVLGYKNLHIFGADSSYGTDGNTHVIRSLVPEKDFVISVGSSPPRWFRTTPEWCAQVNEFRSIYAMFTHHGIEINVHGTGMLPYLYEVMVKKREHLGHMKFMEEMGVVDAIRAQLDAKANEVNAQQKEIEHATSQ